MTYIFESRILTLLDNGRGESSKNIMENILTERKDKSGIGEDEEKRKCSP